MSQFVDAKVLISAAAAYLSEIKNTYNASLKGKTISPTLLVQIKNLMENLRSALDYSAHGLFDKYGSSPKTHPNIYFPYATLSQSQSDFQKAKRTEACIPGVPSARPDIAAKIESYQHFADPKNRWLPVFMELNNENKHQHLSPQTRKETKQLNMKSGGATVSVGQGASISVGKGASIRVGNMVIPGGQKIDVNNPPIYAGSGTVEVITWVSFIFSDNDEAVMPLLETAVVGVERIVNELSTM